MVTKWHGADLPLAGRPEEAHRTSGLKVLDVAHIVKRTKGSAATVLDAYTSEEKRVQLYR